MVPVIAASFNLGAYTWLWIFACLLVLYRKSWKRALALVPFGAYFLTNLLGPVVKMRYHYPFIACAASSFLSAVDHVEGSRQPERRRFREYAGRWNIIDGGRIYG